METYTINRTYQEEITGYDFLEKVREFICKENLENICGGILGEISKKLVEKNLKDYEVESIILEMERIEEAFNLLDKVTEMERKLKIKAQNTIVCYSYK